MDGLMHWRVGLIDGGEIMRSPREARVREKLQRKESFKEKYSVCLVFLMVHFDLHNFH